MSTSPLTITVSYDGRVCVLAATGDLDLTTAGRFARCARRALDDQPERLLFDLAGLTFLDCAGARALTAAAQAAQQGCPVLLRSASPIAARMMGLLGLVLEHQPATPAQAAQSGPDPQPDPGPQPASAADRTGTRAQVINLDRARTRARLTRAAHDLAVTEEQIATTFARLATQWPARADELTAVSQSAHAYATSTRQWADNRRAAAGAAP